MMTFKAENSTAIARVDYNPESKVMSITFKTSGTYDYPEVPEEIYRNFEVAPSKGKYFNQVVRNFYKTEGSKYV